MAFKLLNHEDGDEELVRAMQDHVELYPKAVPAFLKFIPDWISLGKKIPIPVLERMKTWLTTLPSTPALQECLTVLEKDMNFFSPVLGRWSTQVTPQSDMLAWMRWSSESVAVALTSMCLPFFRVRAHEFDETNPGKHLKDLNVRHRVVSHFVVLSILTALNTSKSLGVKCTKRWLKIAVSLEKLHNFHMLFAIQNALQRHQLDRLAELWTSLARKDLKIKVRWRWR